MKVLATTALSFTMFMAMGFQVVRQRPVPPKAQQVERYDPDKLGPGEVACGREDPGKSDRCKCMQHRQKASESAQLECYKVENKAERAKCMIANEICSVVPRDAEHAEYDNEGNQMPSECKRTCRKARCECCKS